MRAQMAPYAMDSAAQCCLHRLKYTHFTSTSKRNRWILSTRVRLPRAPAEDFGKTQPLGFAHASSSIKLRVSPASPYLSHRYRPRRQAAVT